MNRWVVLSILCTLTLLLVACALPGFSEQPPAPNQGNQPLSAPESNSQPGPENSKPEPQKPPEAAPALETPSYSGLWMEEGTELEMTRVITITRQSVYLVETVASTHSVREEYSTIQSIDTDKKIITLQIQWIRANGKMGGTDSRTWYLGYAMDGERMQIATSRNPEEPAPNMGEAKVFVRK